MDIGSLTLGIFLVVLGFVLVGLEVFLPTGGILGMLALSSMAVGIAFAFKYGTISGVVVLGLTALGTPFVFKLLLWVWPRTSMGKMMTVHSTSAEETIGNMASHLALDLLIGKVGKTLSDLRPSGIVEFNGRRIDAISEGILIAEGVAILCVSAQGGHIVVKPAIGPDLNDLENVQIPSFN